MKILVLNAGSSSLKYKLFENDKVVAQGNVAHIGEKEGVRDHAHALMIVEESLANDGVLPSLDQLDGVGHRVVHGGERFMAPTRIDEEVMGVIESLIVLAPLHNGPNLEGIKTVAKQVPHVPQVAVFDTAFHQTIPEHAWRYAIPKELYEKHGIRRYGFHGTSHEFVAHEAAKRLGKPLSASRLITLHLGNGASLCAIKEGRSIDTSMGFTPLEGLVMGTRSGDLDPSIPLWLQREGYDAESLLNKESGLKGLCGDNDVSHIQERAMGGDRVAQMALQVYVHRIRHYIGAYIAELQIPDALVFTGGVGEHSVLVRQMVCEGLEHFGIVLDAEKNLQNGSDIADDNASVRLFVIPTDEERAIARKTYEILQEHSNQI